METIKNVLNEYDINIINIEEIKKGYASKKWYIKDNKNNEYIIKEVQKQKENRLKYFLSVQNLLEKDAANIIKTKKNKLYCTFDNKYYYVCQYIHYETIDLNNKSIYNLGAFLAKVHAKMEQIKISGEQSFIKIENNLDKINEYIKYHQQYNNEIQLEILKYKKNILENKKNVFNYNEDNLCKQIIHGDYYVDNVLKTSNGLVMIDFDQSCMFYKEYELMRGLFMNCNFYCLDTKTKKLIKNFFKGYYDIFKNKISIEDAYNLYFYVQLNSLSSVKPGDEGNPLKVDFAKKRFNILKNLYKYREEIINLLLEVQDETA